MRQPRGQNFLVEKNIARKIVAAADISPADKILEIGPGKGVLTALIAPLAGEFRAVEVDRQLFESLNTSGRFPNTKFVLADFLEYPFASDLGPLKIVANLPYNVSTAIIEKFLPENNWTIAVVMVQKEVGERLTASPGTKEYGSLTIFCRHYAGIVKLFSVGPGCFFPKPKVDSVVLKLVNHFSPRLSQEFTRFVKSRIFTAQENCAQRYFIVSRYTKISGLEGLRAVRHMPQPKTRKYEYRPVFPPLS